MINPIELSHGEWMWIWRQLSVMLPQHPRLLAFPGPPGTIHFTLLFGTFTWNFYLELSWTIKVLTHSAYTNHTDWAIYPDWHTDCFFLWVFAPNKSKLSPQKNKTPPKNRIKNRIEPLTFTFELLVLKKSCFQNLLILVKYCDGHYNFFFFLI